MTSLTIFMEALLKDLMGFHFSAKWLWKSEAFFCWRRFCSEIELLSAGEMGSSCLGFKSLDALSFYETVEIGTLRAARVCYRTIVRIVLHFFTILQRFWGFSRGL